VVVEAGKSIDNIPVFENNDTGYQLQGTIFTNQERAFAIALVALLLLSGMELSPSFSSASR
jgi:hypothetical protein